MQGTEWKYKVTIVFLKIHRNMNLITAIFMSNLHFTAIGGLKTMTSFIPTIEWLLMSKVGTLPFETL